MPILNPCKKCRHCGGLFPRSSRQLCDSCRKAVKKKNRESRPEVRSSYVKGRVLAFCYKCHRPKPPHTRLLCVECTEERRRTIKPYRQHIKAVCERCGFLPEHDCQLQAHHLDGDHGNDEAENIQTLCANCHNLRTFWDRRNNQLEATVPLPPWRWCSE